MKPFTVSTLETNLKGDERTLAIKTIVMNDSAFPSDYNEHYRFALRFANDVASKAYNLLIPLIQMKSGENIQHFEYSNEVSYAVDIEMPNDVSNNYYIITLTFKMKKEKYANTIVSALIDSSIIICYPFVRNAAFAICKFWDDDKRKSFIEQIEKQRKRIVYNTLKARLDNRSISLEDIFSKLDSEAVQALLDKA